MRVDDVNKLAQDVLAKAPSGTEVKYETANPPYFALLMSLVPWLLVFGFIWFFLLRQLRASAGGADHRGGAPRRRH